MYLSYFLGKATGDFSGIKRQEHVLIDQRSEVNPRSLVISGH